MGNTLPYPEPSLPPPSPVNSAEKWWILSFATLVMAVTTIPYLLGYAMQGNAWRFTGFIFGVEDGNSYIAKMLSGSYGAWLFRTPYTTEGQRGVLAFLPYILLGKLASGPGLHEQLVALFQLFRIFTGMLDILATYYFIAFFIDSVAVRRIGLILASLGGGLGWIVVLFGQATWLGSLPLEFYSPETFGFLAILGLPHIALARAGLLIGIRAYLMTWRDEGSNYRAHVFLLSASWTVVALAQPLTAGVMGLLLGLHWTSLIIWQGISNRSNPVLLQNRLRPSALMLISAAVLPGMLLLYTGFMFRVDPFLRGWTAQNIIKSPHPAHYVLAYGALIPLAILGGTKLLSRFGYGAWLPTVWVLLFPILAYTPANLQRRLPEGVWVAIVVLALAAFQGESRPSLKWNLGWGWALLVLCLPSTLMLFAGGVRIAMLPAIPVFRPTPEVEAFIFINREANAGDVVLTSYITGNALPAWAPVRVVVGHGPESLKLPEYQNLTEKVYTQSTPEDERRDLLALWDVRFVFLGPNEKTLGNWDPSRSVLMRLVYQSGGYEIFELIER